MTVPTPEPNPAPTPEPAPTPTPEPPEPAPTPSNDGAIASALKDIQQGIAGLPDAIGNILNTQPAPASPPPEPTPTPTPEPTPPPGEPNAPESRVRYHGAPGSGWFYGTPDQ